MSNGPWTDEENDLVVADYFAMLADDIAGQPYNKARAGWVFMEPRTSENAFEPLREAAISDSVLTHPALSIGGRSCYF